MIVDGKYYDAVTPESALDILGALPPEDAEANAAGTETVAGTAASAGEGS
jgi:hypothetical protein